MTVSHDAATSPARTAVRVPARVRGAVQKAIEEQNGACAAVLFGSRARRTHAPDSDWDIAIITEGKTARQAPIEPLFELEEAIGSCNALVVTADELHHHRDRADGILAQILHQGVIIAGAWNRPAIRERRLRVRWAQAADLLMETEARLWTFLASGAKDEVPEEPDPALCAFARMALVTAGLVPNEPRSCRHLSEQLRTEADIVANTGQALRLRSITDSLKAAGSARSTWEVFEHWQDAERAWLASHIERKGHARTTLALHLDRLETSCDEMLAADIPDTHPMKSLLCTRRAWAIESLETMSSSPGNMPPPRWHAYWNKPWAFVRQDKIWRTKLAELEIDATTVIASYYASRPEDIDHVPAVSRLARFASTYHVPSLERQPLWIIDRHFHNLNRLLARQVLENGTRAQIEQRLLSSRYDADAHSKEEEQRGRIRDRMAARDLEQSSEYSPAYVLWARSVWRTERTETGIKIGADPQIARITLSDPTLIASFYRKLLDACLELFDDHELAAAVAQRVFPTHATMHNGDLELHHDGAARAERDS